MRRSCLRALVTVSMLAVASVTLYTPKKEKPLANAYLQGA